MREKTRKNSENAKRWTLLRWLWFWMSEKKRYEYKTKNNKYNRKQLSSMQDYSGYITFRIREKLVCMFYWMHYCNIISPFPMQWWLQFMRYLIWIIIYYRAILLPTFDYLSLSFFVFGTIYRTYTISQFPSVYNQHVLNLFLSGTRYYHFLMSNQ